MSAQAPSSRGHGGGRELGRLLVGVSVKKGYTIEVGVFDTPLTWD